MNEDYYVCKWLPADSSFKIVKAQLPKSRAKDLVKSFNDCGDQWLYIMIKRY